MGKKRYEKLGKHVICLSEMYYLTYTGGTRELESKKQKEWDKTNNLPLLLQIKERKKIGFDNNPNVVPIKGSLLVSFFKDKGFVPFFDSFFAQSKVLQLTDIVIFESIKQKSYEIALRS